MVDPAMPASVWKFVVGLLSRGNAQQRVVDQVSALLERIDRHALIVAVHAAQIVLGNWVWVDAINGNAAAAPRTRVCTGLKHVRRHWNARPKAAGTFGKGAVQISVGLRLDPRGRQRDCS